MLSTTSRSIADPKRTQNNMDSWNNSQRSLRPTTLPPLFSTKPMIIPSKGQRRSENERPQGRHAGVPPAVAALLAVTAIPRPTSKKARAARRRAEEVFYGPPTPPSAQYDCEVEIEGGESSLEELYHQGATKTTLEMLLSAPEDDDEYDSSEMSRSDSDGLLSVRSTSTESVPSLETDNESTFSYSSSYSNASRRRASADARARIIASPPEECDTDHPLLFGQDGTKTPELPGPTFSEDTLKRVTRRLNLKSNLTASLRVLKSAARSFSSLTATAAAMQPDDYLTRSILSISPQYTDEKRPALSKEVPTPAVRRYLNPWAATYDESPCTGAIQMQTYNSSTGRKSGRSARKAEVESQPRTPEPTERQRENRENSSFLRVIVLEMNMRREGKLSETAQGRARLVLPPRQPCKMRVMGDPSRWKAWTCVSVDE